MTEKEMYDRINGTSQDTGFSINEKARGLDGTFAALMRKVYVWMTLALVITGFTAYSVANYDTWTPLASSSSIRRL